MRRRAGIVGSIVGKDILEFTRDRFFVVVSLIGLVFYVGIFWLLPNTVNETIVVGVHLPGAAAQGDVQALAGQGTGGLEVASFETSESLHAAVEDGSDVVVGLDFPADFLATVASGDDARVQVLVTGEVPVEVRTAMTGIVRELAFQVSGVALPVSQVTEQQVVLGADRAGNQVSIRERMQPLLAFFVLIMETMALATLVAGEIQHRTVTAVLVTPASTADFLAAKSIVGTGLAFTQVVLLMLLIGALGSNTILLLVTLLLGALLVTGFGLIAGSSGRDFVGIVFWSMMFMIPMAIPAFAALFPGSAAGWVKLLPTYGLVQTIVGVGAYGDGWTDVLPELTILLGWCIAAFAAGLLTLRRKVATL